MRTDHPGQRGQSRGTGIGGHVHQPFAQRGAFSQERPRDRRKTARTSKNLSHMVMRPQSQAFEACALITHDSPLLTNPDRKTNIAPHRRI